MLKMADSPHQAMGPLECEEFVRGAIRCGLPLVQIERYLDWLELLQASSATAPDLDELD